MSLAGKRGRDRSPFSSFPSSLPKGGNVIIIIAN